MSGTFSRDRTKGYLELNSATARNSPVEETRLDGELFQSALDDVAQHLATRLSVQGDSNREILEHFASDSGHAG
ncbi:hypothetical protein I2485_14850 [Nesterenkonia sp. E16_7]|nr:hypothetical protein [Nesterenkonia sp. E16_7]